VKALNIGFLNMTSACLLKNFYLEEAWQSKTVEFA
jgi:hypothetical protein